MSSGREGMAIVLTCFFTAGTGNWGWVFAWPVTAGTGVNGLNKKSELVTKCLHKNEFFYGNQSEEVSLQLLLKLTHL